MNRSCTASVAVLEPEISQIREILQNYAGTVIPKSSEELEKNLAQYLVANDFSNAADFVNKLRRNASDCDALLGELVPANTSFFRYPDAFTALEKQIVPEIVERKALRGDCSLRIWSAGCATGEEAYSIAMSVCEALNESNGGWKLHIVASDLCAEALKFAARGVYEEHAIRDLPPHLVSAYFSSIAQQYMVKARLRNLVSFTRTNLTNPEFLGHFDCIFCMGVLPYLSTQHRTTLLQRLHMFLEPGGYLFLGQSEKIPAAGVSFVTENYLSYTFLRRPMAAAARSGR